MTWGTFFIWNTLFRDWVSPETDKARIWLKETPWLGVALGNNILERNEGSGIEQWERSNYRTAATEGSSYHTRKSEAGLWEMSQMQARKLGFYKPPAKSRWMLAAPDWDLTLGEGISLAESNSWRETGHWAISSQYTWWLRGWVPWLWRALKDTGVGYHT